MKVTIDIPDEYTAGLQVLADAGGHASIAALCYAPIVELGKTGMARKDAADAVTILAAVKADPVLKAQLLAKGSK